MKNSEKPQFKNGRRVVVEASKPSKTSKNFKKETEISKKIKFYKKKILIFLNPITVKDKASFTKQFATLVKNGISVITALTKLSTKIPNVEMREIVAQIANDIRNGVKLSDAMRKHPRCFDSLYISTIIAGETGGVLSDLLIELSEMLEDMDRLKNKIRSALAYPFLVLVLSILMFVFMCVFIVPTFAGIFKGLGSELPFITKFILGISNLITSWLIIIPLIIIMLIYRSMSRYYRTEIGRLTIDRQILKFPLVGIVVEKVILARFCRIFATLWKAGVPIITIFNILVDTSGNKIISNAIAACSKRIERGEVISQSLEKEAVFPELVIMSISTGEEAGELDEMMFTLARSYEDEVDRDIKTLTSYIEPIMMVFVAGIVVVILLAMYLPMFDIFNKIN